MIHYQICSNCDASTTDLTANFCIECGFQLDPVLQLCKNCKQKLHHSWLFCKNCGTRIKTVNATENYRK